MLIVAFHLIGFSVASTSRSRAGPTSERAAPAMKDYSVDDVQVSLDELTARFGLRAPPGLQEEFARGLHLNLLAYDKVTRVAPTLTALERYLVGARSFLRLRPLYLVQAASGAEKDFVRTYEEPKESKLGLGRRHPLSHPVFLPGPRHRMHPWGRAITPPIGDRSEA